MAPFNIDKANPADDSLVSQFPANERQSRTQIEAWMNLEHDAASGRHRFKRGSQSARNNITDWVDGSVWLHQPASARPHFQFFDGNQWLNISEFAGGTRLCFPQASAPDGWTHDTSIGDRVLRVTAATASGGGLGGSWTISGFTTGSLSTQGHVLTEAQLPAHRHGMGRVAISFGDRRLDSGAAANNNAFGVRSGDTNVDRMDLAGSNQAHSHGVTGAPGHNGTWRPLHLNAIVCVKS